MLNSKQRAFLRSKANSEEPILHLGKGGLSEPLLRQAEDAWLCDSTHLDFEGTVQAILAYIRQRIGEVPCR